MKIQSLSVVVPAKKCINDCKFCVSKMHESEYDDMISGKNMYRDLYKRDFINRLEFARDNGCNTVMLTGDCEPLQNWNFLEKFGDYNQSLLNPFKIIELQTVGNLLDRDKLYFLRHHVGVTTISLSISNIWSDRNNADIIGCDIFNLKTLCNDIKKYGFNLRISLNMLDTMLPGITSVSGLFMKARALGADQLTVREMYEEEGTEQGRWVRAYKLSADHWSRVNTYVNMLTVIDRLEYGREKRTFGDISVVVDNDCMSQKASEVAKYLILRPNAKLYSRWDTKASLIF